MHKTLYVSGTDIWLPESGMWIVLNELLGIIDSNFLQQISGIS